MLTRSMPTDPAALAAAQEALRRSTIEIWTLFAVGFVVTVIRTGARLHAVGIKGLRADDYLAWVGIVGLPPILLVYSTQYLWNHG